MLTEVLLPIVGAALVPLIVGFFWYNPKVFGLVWMKAADMTEEKAKGANMGMIFGVTILLSFFLVGAVAPFVIHQTHLFSIFKDEPGFLTQDANAKTFKLFSSLMNDYGTHFRSFKHGALHGFLAGIVFVLPVLGVNALFERRSYKYILVNVGYWTVTLSLMGGILCAFLKWEKVVF
jgi:hypothetical protein